jgi:hypothetical protein
MALEHHHAEAVPDRLADRSDPSPLELGENFGWLLVQRDWSLRQREPRPGRIVAALRRRVAAAAAWLRRLVRRASRGAVHGPGRHSEEMP